MPASGSSNWGATIEAVWLPAVGEEAAQDACLDFVATGMLRYERDLPVDEKRVRAAGLCAGRAALHAPR